MCACVRICMQINRTKAYIYKTGPTIPKGNGKDVWRFGLKRNLEEARLLQSLTKAQSHSCFRDRGTVKSNRVVDLKGVEAVCIQSISAMLKANSLLRALKINSKTLCIFLFTPALFLSPRTCCNFCDQFPAVGRH